MFMCVYIHIYIQLKFLVDKRENEAEEIFEDITAENCTEIMKDTNIIQQIQQISSKEIKKIHTQVHH